MKNLGKAFWHNSLFVFASITVIILLQSCASAPNNSKYFGYNNSPDREEEPDYTVREVEPRRATPGQSSGEWVNPLANSRSQEDIELEQSVSEREQTVINNYYYYQPRGYVPVIQPWHAGYRGWASRRSGLTITVGTGWYYSSNPFYDSWHDWYNPWYDYHPYYGYTWSRPRRVVAWYNDPWVGRNNSTRRYRDEQRVSTRRTSGVTRSRVQGGQDAERRGTRRTDVNTSNGVSRTTKYGSQKSRRSSNPSVQQRKGTRRSTNNSGGSRYSGSNNSSGSSKSRSYKPSKSNNSGGSSGSSVRRGTRRSGGSGGSNKSSGSGGSKRRR